MMGTFKIENENPFDVKDIGIKCTLTGNSGTELDTASTTVYEIVPANKTKTFREVNLGFVRSQTSKASCEITTAEAM